MKAWTRLYLRSKTVVIQWANWGWQDVYYRWRLSRVQFQCGFQAVPDEREQRDNGEGHGIYHFSEAQEARLSNNGIFLRNLQ